MNIDTIPTFEDVNESDVILQLEEDTQEQTQEESQENQEQLEAPEVDPLAQATYESLVEKGIIDADEAFDGSFNYLDEQFEQLPSKLLKSAIDDLPEHSQTVLKFIAAAGSNLDPDELKEFLKTYIGEQDVPDVSSIDAARSYLETELRNQGLRPNAIQAQLDDLEDSDELVSEAEKLLKSKEKKTTTLIQNKEESVQATARAQKEFVQSVNTTLSEIGWSKPQQQKVLQMIPNANNVLNEVVKSPKAYVQLMDLLSKFNGKEFDLGDIEKRGESRAASTLKDKITKSGFVSGSGKTTAADESPLTDLFKEFKPFV